ncbi:hypothetical protein HOT81_gp049 [Gordonia phage Fryberger]|uniref:Uncharacterized protein n=1 Tax=Gordonia phage Fryberger TaxID=2250392 RepID=A0A346FCK3_9CAUD|nr:hypothetical protein HOT81_gp049 [Gordonia phage Fryberger]AXN53467.1 hypothetical protein SEA_FRYBERGER_49 [Gordonia phage Fryberger]
MTNFEDEMKLQIQRGNFFLCWYDNEGKKYCFIPTVDLFFMFNPYTLKWTPHLYDELPSLQTGEKMEFWQPYRTNIYMDSCDWDCSSDYYVYRKTYWDMWGEVPNFQLLYATGADHRFIFKIGENVALAWEDNPNGSPCDVLDGERLQDHIGEVGVSGYWRTLVGQVAEISPQRMLDSTDTSA